MPSSLRSQSPLVENIHASHWSIWTSNLLSGLWQNIETTQIITELFFGNMCSDENHFPSIHSLDLNLWMLYAHRFDFNSSSGQSVVYLATDLDCIHNLDCPGPYGPVCANNSCLLECQPHQIQTDDGNCSLSIETSWFKGYRCVKKNQ